ncbi:MAG: glycerate kinase [Firmicutes bacterium]|nr:glycerate kinase [Bacillota bacterium]
MRVVIAPDSFKGSLSAWEAAAAIERGVKRAAPNCETVLLPLSDGGEGLVESLVEATNGTYHEFHIMGPLGEPVWAKLGVLGDGETAVIEMAQASGLTLIPEEERNPLLTTTYGTGELIRLALDLGCRHLIIGLGGSATNDGGAGMAQALGVRLLDSAGDSLGLGGAELARLASIDVSELDPRLNNVKIQVACDVTNPLTGPQGASAVYGPQKGATPKMVEQLDQALANYAEVIRKDLGIDVESVPGAGAAGGLGAGLLAFLRAELVSGIELVLNTVNFRAAVDTADLVFTGEGKLDAQSAYGKVPIGVARACKPMGIPVVVLAGSVELDTQPMYDDGITACFAVANGPMTLEESMDQAAKLLEFKAEQVMKVWLAG